MDRYKVKINLLDDKCVSFDTSMEGYQDILDNFENDMKLLLVTGDSKTPSIFINKTSVNYITSDLLIDGD